AERAIPLPKAMGQKHGGKRILFSFFCPNAWISAYVGWSGRNEEPYTIASQIGVVECWSGGPWSLKIVRRERISAARPLPESRKPQRGTCLFSAVAKAMADKGEEREFLQQPCNETSFSLFWSCRVSGEGSA